MRYLRIFGWTLCALLGLALAVGLIVVSEKARDFGGETIEADAGIDKMLENAPALTPQDYDYPDYPEQQWTSADEGLKIEFAGSNEFILTAAFLLLIGLTGYAMMTASLARRPSARLTPLVMIGAGSLTFYAFLLFGFDFAFPTDYLPGRIIADYSGPWFATLATDPFEYGLAFTMWTDFLFQAAYAMTPSILLLGLLAGNYRTPAVLAVSLAVGIVGYPLITSWIWADGWLTNMGSYDFAGAANLHVLAGSAGLALILLARVFPAEAPGSLRPPDGPPIAVRVPPTPLNGRRLALFLFGSIVFLCTPLAVQAGSVLSNDPEVVPTVVLATFAPILSAALASLIVSFFLNRRPRAVTVTLGGLAGWSAVCAPGDVLGVREALLLGALVGTLATLLLWLLDRFEFDDPLGLVPVSLLGGSISLIAAGAIEGDSSITVQLIVTVATGIVGFTFGATFGILAWLIGMLWERQSPEIVPQIPEAPQK